MQPNWAKVVGELIADHEIASRKEIEPLIARIAALEARPVETDDQLEVPPELAAQIRSVQRLLDEPPPVIVPPEPLPPPRRLTGAMITRDGDLAVLYSDGSSERLGNVAGPPGRDGVSVVGAARNEAGETMWMLSDGTVLTP